jgi:hypothetical protein
MDLFRSRAVASVIRQAAHPLIYATPGLVMKEELKFDKATSSYPLLYALTRLSLNGSLKYIWVTMIAGMNNKLTIQ